MNCFSGFKILFLGLLIIINSSLSTAATATPMCHTYFLKKTSFAEKFFFKEAPPREIYKWGGLFTYDPQVIKINPSFVSRIWSNTWGLWKKSSRYIAKYSIGDSSFRFTPLKPVGRASKVLIPPANLYYLTDFLFDRLTEKFTQKYYGIKKQLRLFVSIPLMALLWAYPATFIDNGIRHIEGLRRQQYELALEQHRSVHEARMKYDFRFIDIKQYAQDNPDRLNGVHLLEALNQRAEEIQKYQQSRMELPTDPSYKQLYLAFKDNKLFSLARSYSEKNSLTNRPLSETDKLSIFQMTNEYLLSLEIVDYFLEAPEIYNILKVNAFRQGNQTILKTMWEIEEHEFTKAVITKYRNWGSLSQDEYKHYLQAFFYFRYQLAISEAIGQIKLIQSDQPYSKDNILTHDMVLSSLVAEIWSLHPEIKDRVQP